MRGRGKPLSEKHRASLRGRTPWNKGKKLEDLIPGYINPRKGVPVVDSDYRVLRKKVHDCCANMVGRVMRIKNEKKAKKTFQYLGYSKESFIEHMESQFLPGMTWENWGEWHVDHIKPVSSFVREGVVDVKTINALPNLQPLWAMDNFKKGGDRTSIPAAIIAI